jgi:hypothetical protein
MVGSISEGEYPRRSWIGPQRIRQLETSQLTISSGVATGRSESLFADDVDPDADADADVEPDPELEVNPEPDLDPSPFADPAIASPSRPFLAKGCLGKCTSLLISLNVGLAQTFEICEPCPEGAAGRSLGSVFVLVSPVVRASSEGSFADDPDLIADPEEEEEG